MRITVAAIGRLKAGPETDLAKRYIKRFDGSGRSLGLGPILVHELPESRDGSAAVRKQDEANRLLEKVGGDVMLFALDEAGRNRDSQAFSELVAKYRDDGTPELAFLIGGPDGHGQTVLDAARERVSLSAMTLPHGLARIVLLEQLYRAATILSGHPYHRA
ncbi:MAG: 23S rRNA (pseudouridine(1915)-N(3))-methyltransferase RlmH [Hyphomicrobiaceae bacterium]